MKKIAFIIITFFCIAACSSNKEQDNLITIPIDPTSSQSVNWEQLFDTASMQVIPLETTDQSLLAWVDRIIITDTLYSFSSNNSIYTFHQNGQFLFKIARQGRGPGEYIYHDDYLHSLYQGHTTTIINHYRNFLGIPHFSISTRNAIFPSGYQNDYFYYLIDPAFIPDKFKNAFCQAHNLSQLDENSNPILVKVKLLTRHP